VKRLLAAGLLALLAPSGPAGAAGSAEIERAREASRAAIEALSTPDRLQAISALHALVEQQFALEAITDFMAGPLGTPSPAQRARLREALQRYTSCALYASLAPVRELRVEPAVRTTRGGAALVRAQVAAPQGEAGRTLDWLIVEREGGPAVMDVRVDGSWTLGRRRAELQALYRRSGEDFEAFLSDLEARPATQADCR
jgi:hypothetical protein